jgi:phospholipase C
MKRFGASTHNYWAASRRVLILAVLGFVLTAPSSRAAEAAAQAKTPIEHIIVVMQENHSFDNYFGTYPGADGLPLDACMPVDPTAGPHSPCVKPFHLAQNATENLGHNATIFSGQYRGGGMTGFVGAHRQSGKDGALAMGYYDGSDLPVYWALANDYVLFDRFFSSAAAGSIRNYMFWVTGSPGGSRDKIPAQGWGDIPTIFDRLEEQGISWKFYVDHYDPRATFRSPDGPGMQVARVPLLAFARYVDNPSLAQSHIVDLEQYYQDLHNGTLPAVAYISAAAASEHPPSNIQAGQRLVRSLVTELMRSTSWSSSAFMVTYSNWGGWYDHVAPPRVDDDGYGFRVPALLVSPYARQGQIESSELDFTSILRFIEDNYDLKPLTARDASAKSIAVAFDFSQPPRAPHLVSSQPETQATAQPRRAGIYLAYGAALIMPALILVWASFSTRRSRRSITLLKAVGQED